MTITVLNLPPDVLVSAFIITGDVKIERTKQRDDSYRWAIRKNGDCMDADGHWTYEPQPSSRDDAFTAAHRFGSADEAIAIALKALGLQSIPSSFDDDSQANERNQ